MAKTKRELIEALSTVHAVAEIIDARIPAASRNPMLDDITKGKPKILVMNRSDLADKGKTAEWAEYYRGCGYVVIECNSKSGTGTQKFIAAAKKLLADKIERQLEKGQVGALLKIMVVGIPNVGKSSFINRLSGRKAAKTEDRPGVTRNRQWIRLDENVLMLDTPGMLMPKIKNEKHALLLAYTGALKDDVMDTETLAMHLIKDLAEIAPDALIQRYKIDDLSGDGATLLMKAAKKRGFLISGGEADTERMAKILLDEFRGGKLGSITLENPDKRN